MVAIITKNSYYLAEEKPDVFVDDKDFVDLIKSRKIQMELLKALNVTALKVARLGRDVGDFFTKQDKKSNIDLKVEETKKELGYYAEV